MVMDRCLAFVVGASAGVAERPSQFCASAFCGDSGEPGCGGSQAGQFTFVVLLMRVAWRWSTRALEDYGLPLLCIHGSARCQAASHPAC